MLRFVFRISFGFKQWMQVETEAILRERSKLDLVASRKALIDDILHVGDIALVHQHIAL